MFVNELAEILATVTAGSNFGIKLTVFDDVYAKIVNDSDMYVFCKMLLMPCANRLKTALSDYIDKCCMLTYVFISIRFL